MKSMGFFDNEDNVNTYIKMVEDYDGEALMSVLHSHLDKKSTLLEIGMGAGKDFDILKKDYEVCGSDFSTIFLDIYKKKHPEADLVLLNAVTMNIDRKFDCIYSNKVLQHLTKDALYSSAENQIGALNDGGLIFHTFWYGEGAETYDGLLFTFYKENELRSIFEKNFEIIDLCRYTEEEKDDSIYIIGKRRLL